LIRHKYSRFACISNIEREGKLVANDLTKNYQGLFLLMLWLALGGEVASGEPQPEMVKRSLELEWVKVPGAISYKLEFKRIDHNVHDKVLIFSTEENHWHGELPLGSFYMRLRAYDQRDVAGSWSDPALITIAPPPVGLIEPAEGLVVASRTRDKETLEFSWTDLGPGVTYLIQVYDASGESVFHRESKEPNISLELTVAAEYSWEVTALARGEVSSDESERRSFSIVGPPIATPQIEQAYSQEQGIISWSRPPFAEVFEVQLHSRSPTDGRWRLVVKHDDVKEPYIDVSEYIQDNRRYRLRVRANAKLHRRSRLLQHVFPRQPSSPNSDHRRLSQQRLDSGLRLTYQYRPTRRANIIASERLNSTLMETALMSHYLGAGYLYAFGKFSLDANLAWHAYRSTVFRDQAEPDSAQSPVSLNSNNIEASLHSMITVRRLSFGFGGGTSLRQEPMVYAINLGAIGANSIDIQDWHGRLSLKLSLRPRVSVEAALLMATALGLDRLIDDYARNQVLLDLQHRLLRRPIVINYFYLRESTKLAYFTDFDEQIVVRNSLSVSIGVGVSFLFPK